jgi:hypothetical protein
MQDLEEHVLVLWHVAINLLNLLFRMLSSEISRYNLSSSVPILQVHPIYDLIRRHKLKLKSETFRSMINLFVKMKDVSHDAGLLFLASCELLFINHFSPV